MHDVGPSKIVVKERFRSSKWFMFKWSPMRLIRSSTSPNAARLAALAHKQRGYLVDFAMKYLLQKLQVHPNFLQPTLPDTHLVLELETCNKSIMCT